MGENAGAGEPEAAAALAAFREAVAEVRALSLKAEEGGESEGALQEAKARLAGALQAATKAGVAQSDLLQASQEPAEEQASTAKGEKEEEDALKPGDHVEIYGLESQGGKLLNGKIGIVQSYMEDKGRFQIQLGPGQFVSVRPANLEKRSATAMARQLLESCHPPAAAGDAKPRRRSKSPKADEAEGKAGADVPGGDSAGAPAEEVPLGPGSRVEIHGLESEGGKKLNGRVGVISELLADSGRFKVELSPGEFVSIKPANLASSPQAAAPPAQGGKRSRSQSGASSRSSSEERKKKKKKDKKRKRPRGGNFSSEHGAALTPEQQMHLLMTKAGMQTPEMQTQVDEAVKRAAQAAEAAQGLKQDLPAGASAGYTLL